MPWQLLTSNLLCTIEYVRRRLVLRVCHRDHEGELIPSAGWHRLVGCIHGSQIVTLGLSTQVTEIRGSIPTVLQSVSIHKPRRQIITLFKLHLLDNHVGQWPRV